MNTVQSEWDKFSKTLPENACDVQISEMRNSFYAGAFSMLIIQANLSLDDVSVKAGTAVLSSIYDECRDYFNNLNKG